MAKSEAWPPMATARPMVPAHPLRDAASNRPAAPATASTRRARSPELHRKIPLLISSTPQSLFPVSKRTFPRLPAPEAPQLFWTRGRGTPTSTPLSEIFSPPPLPNLQSPRKLSSALFTAHDYHPKKKHRQYSADNANHRSVHRHSPFPQIAP